MTDSTHTPGPWRVDPTHRLCIESAAGNIGLVNLARNSEADARLIAAAPELLALCESWLTDFPEFLCECGTPECRTTKLRAVIAKARVRS